MEVREIKWTERILSMMGETMNKNQLHAMLKNYVDNFERVNNEEHEEYYKWQV